MENNKSHSTKLYGDNNVTGFMNIIANISKNATGMTTNILYDTARKIMCELSSLMIYTISVNERKYKTLLSAGDYFKHIVESFDDNEYESAFAEESNRFNMPNDSMVDYTMYKGTPIRLTVNVKQNSDDRSLTVKFHTIRTKNNISNINEFIRVLINKSASVQNKQWTKRLIVFNNFSLQNVMSHPRTFNDVFIKDKDRLKIVSSVKHFMNNREWYDKHHIPYHYGILLHGQPGGGKTSIAQAIATLSNGRCVNISGDEIFNISVYMNSLSINGILDHHVPTVLIIEDIDCGLDADKISPRIKSNANSDNATKSSSGLATLLNCIDGIASHQNIIYIFTTNHIETLDPALIRPGRIDLKIDIDCVSNETFTQFCKHHYGDAIKLPSGFNVRDGLSFAELQTNVMRGDSFKQLCDYVGDKELKQDMAYK